MINFNVLYSITEGEMISMLGVAVEHAFVHKSRLKCPALARRTSGAMPFHGPDDTLILAL